MARVTAISFEDNVTKVVRATREHGILTVKDTLCLAEGELGAFLQNEKTDKFTVVCNFTQFYQDTLFLPPVDRKFLDSLVQAEIKKKYPDLQGFSYSYRIIGDSHHEGKPYKKIACFVFKEEEVSAITDRFTACNKSVKHLYNSADVLARFVKCYENMCGETLLCIADSAVQKTIFVLENEELCFVRHIPSSGEGFTDLETQNINMTVDYCFQSLRIRPTRAVLLDRSSSVEAAQLKLMAPIAGLMPPPHVRAPEETIWEYAAPIAALANPPEGETGDLLPPAYRSHCMQMTSLRYGTVVLILLSILGMAGIAEKYINVLRLNETIQGLRTKLEGMDAVARAYDRVNNEISAAMPEITYLNTMNASPGVQQALMTLDCLRVRDVQVKSIVLKRQEESIRMEIKAEIAAGSFVGMQSTLEQLVTALEKHKGAKTVSRKLEPNDRTCLIEVDYRP